MTEHKKIKIEKQPLHTHTETHFTSSASNTTFLSICSVQTPSACQLICVK